MIKRLIALGTALIMIFTFAACGGKGDTETTTETEEIISGHGGILGIRVAGKGPYRAAEITFV